MTGADDIATDDPRADRSPDDPVTEPPRPTTHRRIVLIAVVGVVVLALDQLSKAWAVDTLSTRSIDLVLTLQLTLARNTGTAFSVGRGTDWGRFVPLLAIGVVVYVIWQGRTVTTKTGAVAIGMIVGGALGNLADRALRTTDGRFFSGGVVDFINFTWIIPVWGKSWPIFNVADACVVVGGFLLVFASLRLPPAGPALDEPSGAAGDADGPDGGDPAGGAPTSDPSSA